MSFRELENLFAKLNIKPNNKKWYELALTHSSYAYERNGHGAGHNERLEFLGDAVLELVTSEILYFRFPSFPEGKLTRCRADLVREESLYRLAIELELGHYIRLGRGEANSGGRKRPALLADAFEALLGAIYLDLGYPTVRKTMDFLFQELLLPLEEGVLLNDYKTLMQEHTQARQGTAPEYVIVSEEGPDHAKIFTAQFLLDGQLYGQGKGRSKKEAEQEAAYSAYLRLCNGEKNK